MEMPGTCQVCQTVGSMHTCKLCGRLVCERHYRASVGACTICKPPSGSPSGSDRPDEAKNLPPLPKDAGGRYT